MAFAPDLMTFLRTLWSFVLALGVASNVGCRMIQCEPRDPSASTIVTLPVEQSRVLTMHGRVLTIETAEPLASARARVTPNGEWRDVDSDGRVELPIPRSGSYTIEVAAEGYDVVSRVVTVRADSGVAWIAVIARSRTSVRDRACGADTAVASPPGA